MNPGVLRERALLLALFLVALATVMFEVLLTRVFSVTMWYHFAFMAISIAMFGMTVGALFVYLSPGRFVPERVQVHLSVAAALFSISIVLSFLAHLAIRVNPGEGLSALPLTALTYGIISVPFVFSGVCVCLALTRFPDRVGALYAADLAGAAAGCFALVLCLQMTDGPTAVFVVAALA